MWLLTSRNRQDMCQAVIDSAAQHGMSTPGQVWCDGCSYPSFRLPFGWARVERREHTNIGQMMREFFARYPNEPWYGWMADDCVPLSEGWDRELVRVAGPYGVAYPEDGWLHGVKDRDGTPHVTSIVCMGGDLVRTMGFWVLSGMMQMYIDDVWESIAVPLGLMRFCPEVKSEHRHFENGKRPRDATDARTFQGRNFVAEDQAIYRAWLASPEYAETLERVRAAC